MEVLEPRVSLGNTPKSIGVLNIMVYISLYILIKGYCGRLSGNLHSDLEGIINPF